MAPSYWLATITPPFKKYQSTEDSIFYFVQQTQDSFHHKPTESTIAAFIDLSQAFDRVWKEKLILKLDELGIEGSMLSWISNFLSKRTIQVNFNNIKSKTTRIYQGLPQGSILSPILFNIYLNDVHTSIKPPAKIALYADDIIIWVSKNNLSDAEQSLNKAMKNLQKVTKKLKLSINISKSEIGLFTINNHLRHWTPNIFLNNSKLQYSDSPRYLGVTLDPALTFKKHIDTMISKAKNRLKILKKNIRLKLGCKCQYLTHNVPCIRKTYFGICYTSLDQCKIQASAAKIISGLRGSCPNRIAELESNLLPLYLRRKICFSKFITKKINSPKEHLTGKFIRNWVPNQRLKRPTPLNMAHNSNLLDIPINPKHRTSYPPHKTRNKLICFPHLPDNPHKHETQPELLKALGLQIIEENSSLFDITIYTDGSQLETGLSGSGIAIYNDKILEKISLSHPRHLSVYKSELSAIDTALKDININSPSKIIIYSDSRAAIYTLQSCFSSQEPLLKSIAKSPTAVTVQWLPAHVGIPGNELADSLAKAGALGLPEARESTTHLDERDLLRTIKTQCLQEWKSDAAHDWYRAGETSTGSVLPREQQSLISRLKSGHLRTMTFQNGCKVFPLCTKCNSQPATPRHIIDCIDSSIDELYSSPADTIKNLKLYRLDTLVEDVLSCNFSNWYSQFKHLTIKSRCVKLSKEFIEYLHSDNIVLPESEASNENWDSDSNDEDWDQNNMDLSNEIPQPEFSTLNTQLEKIINRFGKQVRLFIFEILFIMEDEILNKNFDDDSETENYSLNESSDVSTDEECDSILTTVQMSSSNCFIGKNGYKWNKNHAIIGRTRSHNIITHLPGLKGPAKPKPNCGIDIFNLFFTAVIIKQISEFTNAKIEEFRQRISDLTKSTYSNFTSEIEIRAFLGLLYLAGVYKSGHENVESLFASDGTGRDIFRSVMSVKRFLFLLLCIRFDNFKTRCKEDRLSPIRDIFQTIIEKFQSCYTPAEYLTVDEMLVGFRAKCPFKIYIPSKPNKYGIKIVILADSRTHYMYNAMVYTGKSKTPKSKELSLPTQIVLDISRPLWKSNRNITADNWFTSIELVDKLKEHGLTYLGTMRKNKPQIPPQFQPHPKRESGTSIFGFSGTKTLVSYVPKK
ncbi:hypothetical protein LAZ67_22002256 [Cordylochernes scorpioides]|uniref:Uncharacterized protein n=1 Tax=Cordylochernes scorpioides TaxID=51811 RepID=A0ABY6LUA6_9ARAC|nr:hypothetical protein LAZ67_22002256 [Cordylochernes scorpioides]